MPRRIAPAATGLGVAAGVTLLLAGYALWVQFFGPLTQRGSSFTPDFYKNDLTGFVTPSGYLLFHTAASAAAAARYQGGPPEYLGYLGWPLIAVLAVVALACWRQPAVRATAVTLAVLELLSLGGHPLISGTPHAGVTLPWHWLEGLPVLGTALPDRLSIVADGVAAALLAFGIDRARAWSAGPRAAGAGRRGGDRGGGPRLPAADPAAAPGGERRAAPGGLVRRLRRAAPPAARPGPGRPGPDGDPHRRAALAGRHRGARLADRRVFRRARPGTGRPTWRATASPLPPSTWTRCGPAARPSRPPRGPRCRPICGTWRPAAVVAVTGPDSALGHYLEGLFGRPAFRDGGVLAWRR